MQRGVMLPPIALSRKRTGTSFAVVGDGSFLQAAPAAILYWDKVYAPVAIRGMAPQYDAAVDRMTDLGIAESVDIKSENSFTELDIPVMLEKYSDTLSALDKRDGELWSVLPLTSPDRDTLSDQASGFLRRSASPTASVEVTLRKALPVPDREVPYEDLLDFKAKRKEQLDRLHSEISLLAGKYIHNKDDATALGLALMDLRTALSDLEKVYSERWTVRALKDLSSAFIINGLWPAGVTYMVGVPIDKAFLAGAGATVLHTAVAATVSAKHGSNPYAYAISAAAI